MSEILEWMSIAIAADTNRAVHEVAQGQGVMAQLELRKQLDNTTVNAVVDLYAKTRDLRQRGELLGAFTLAIAAKAKYYDGLPNLQQANLKMQLIEIDEKLNGELSQLMIPEQIPKVVDQLGLFLKSEIDTTRNRIKDISSKIAKERDPNKLEGDIRIVVKASDIMRRYFDPGLAGPLGNLRPTWEAGVATLEKTFAPEIAKLRQEVSVMIDEWSNANRRAFRRPIIRGAIFWLFFLGFVAFILWLCMRVIPKL